MSLYKAELMEMKSKNSEIPQQKRIKKINDERCKIFLSCLPKKLSKEDILNYFTHRYGTNTEFEFSFEKKNPKSEGLINGILTCSDQTTARKILENKTHEIEKYKLKAKSHLTEKELKELLLITRKKRIYIKRLPECFDNEKLKTILSIYGDIEQAYCVHGKKNRKKGFKYGYAIFKEIESLQNIPYDGIPFGDHDIEWTSYEKKMKKRVVTSLDQVNSDQPLKEQEPEKDQVDNEKKDEYNLWNSDKLHFFKPGSVFYHRLNQSFREKKNEKNVRLNLLGTGTESIPSGKVGESFGNRAIGSLLRVEEIEGTRYRLF